jgi:hypothetical protein
MINGGRSHLLDAPHLTIFLGVFLALVVLGFNFLGDGLRDQLDPRTEKPAGKRLLRNGARGDGGRADPFSASPE